MSYDYQHIQVKPINGRIGAEIQGIQLSSQLAQAVIQEINQALLQYKAIFFKGQHHLDDLEQEAFAARLGAPLNHPTVPVKQGSKHILELDSAHGARADSWHTDITFIDAYPKASILRSVVAPAAGGDTAWANTTSAYEALPAPLKVLADSLRAVHSNDYDYAGSLGSGAAVSAEKLSIYRSFFNSTENTKLNILWCGCIRKLARKPCYWATSLSVLSVLIQPIHENCLICSRVMW